MHPATRIRAVSLAVVVTLLASISAGASESDEIYPLAPAPIADTGTTAAETPDLWFVQLAGPPTVAGGRAGTIQNAQSNFRSAAARAGVAFTERYAFQTLWNGLSIRVAPGNVGALSRLSGVTGLWPVATISIPETSTSGPDLATALAMTGADVAQSELGLTGAGIKVAIMDTGIDYHHPDLGGCFGAGCRVVTGWDFVGDGFNASGTTAQETTPRPDPDPDDCNGHGTHVAGIVGASGAVTGVAPGVTFGAYRVFGCVGSTTADIMIAAMERALADGMHVLNMSIGSAFQWPSYPTATAASNLVGAGMVVVASIGNSGASGVYSTGAPGNGDKVIGVASFDNSHLNVLTFDVNPSGQKVGYLPLSVTPDPPTSGTTPEVVWLGRGCVSTLGDTHLADPSGKVALLVRGDCTFQEKYQGAADAGAVGVVIHNNVPGMFAGGGVTSRGIFGVGISLADGLHIRSLASPTLTWTDERINSANPTGGLISSFSSYGHAPDLSLKPDIGAPGGLIRSTWPLEKGAYAILSGTSMSSPHVAGAAALYLEAHPGTAAGDLRTIFQNSADPRPWWGFPTGPFLDQVHRQGAGMLDIAGAVQANARLEPGKIALGEQLAGAVTVRDVTITNSSADAVTYALSHRSALSTFGNTYAPSASTLAAAVAFSQTSVTVPAGGSATVAVTFSMPAVAPAIGVQLGGYIVATGGGATYRVPYAAFRGDYQAIAALTAGGNGFPWLAKRVSTTAGSPLTDWEKQADGAVYTLKHTDLPWILFHLDHQVSRLTIDVHEADGTHWGRVIDVADFGRNGAATSFFALSWDGKAASPTGPNVKVVKNASYFFKLTVVKALGDPANPAHVQTWTSPTFVVDRGLGN